MLKRLEWISLVVGLAALAVVICLPRPRKSPPAQRVRMITYNAQFLPSVGAAFNRRPDPEYRALALADHLAGCDVAGLCEVFDLSIREKLLCQLEERLGADFHCVVPQAEDRSAFGIDSGLILVSRLPIVQSHCIKYGNDSPISEFGLLADGFAAKGALHARLGRGSPGSDDDRINVVVTHLESEDSKRREAQYGMLADFIRAHCDPDEAVIVMGDLNTVADTVDTQESPSQYQRLLSTLREVRPDLLDLGTLQTGPGGTSDPESPDGGQRIDYIFLSNPQDGERLTPVAVETRKFPDSKVGFLSDHCAVGCELEWLAR